jgi:hypothetical protein
MKSNFVSHCWIKGVIYKLPLYFKDKAFETVAFTLKRAPSGSVETTPYELWHGIKPKLFLQNFGMLHICKMFTTKVR